MKQEKIKMVKWVEIKTREKHEDFAGRFPPEDCGF